MRHGASVLRRGAASVAAGIVSLALLGFSVGPATAETISGGSAESAQSAAEDAPAVEESPAAEDAPEAGVDPGAEPAPPLLPEEGEGEDDGDEPPTETGPGPAEGVEGAGGPEGEEEAGEGASVVDGESETDEGSLEEAQGGFSTFASDRVQDNPVNPATAGTGPAATSVAVTSTVTPSGTQGPATSRTYTVRYTNTATTNTAANSVKNARIWLPFTVDADHVTTYTVSCASSTTATGNNLTTCPTTAGMPSGPQTIVGEAGVANNLLWGVVNIGRGSQYIEFTIEATTLLAPQSDACAAQTVAVNATANYSLTGFLPANVQRTASVSAPIDSGQCANGAVTMTNTVKSPLSLGQPTRVLSGDPRVFEATWHNTTSAPITLPIGYSYVVPSEGATTQASWTCTASTGTCPDLGAAAVLTSDGAGTPQRVFGSDPDDADTYVTLAPGQKLTFAVTLATTVSNCSTSGYVDVQTQATRGHLGTDPATAPMSVASPTAQIGCAEWLVTEPFSGTTVTDNAWRAIGRACLTDATATATAPALGGCGTYTTGVPTPTFNPGTTGLPAGFLQLTDDRTYQVGAVLYDRGIPTKNGLVLEFTQYQFGQDAQGADGIGFFLANGAFPLTTTGADGGALGYANKSAVAGLPNGYLGVGFDVYGNFAATSNDAAPQCGGNGTRVLSSVTLRGPGNGASGYCAVGPTVALSSLNSSYTLRYQRATTVNNANLQTALLSSQRKTRVTVYPLADGQAGPRVTVEMDFGAGYVPVLDRQMTAAAPALVKFGFLGSTGGSKDAHLLGSVRVGTVLPLENLSLTKVVNGSLPAGQKSSFDVGDSIPYQFVLDNTGPDTVYQVKVTDPQISNVTCPATQIAAGGQIICTGSYTVQVGDRTAGHFLNKATAVGALSSTGLVNLSSTDDEDVPVNPTASDATRVIVPGGTASFQILDNGSTAGLVLPDDPAKVTIRLIDPTTGLPTDATTITVPGQGTWVLDATKKVTFQPNAGYTGTVSPLKYEARSNTVVDGTAGSARGTLSVSLSVAPLPVCTPDQNRASSRYWEFGTNVELDFEASGTALPTAGSAPGVASGSTGTFTVTDARGNLQFTVDPGAGRIIAKDGSVMTQIPVGVGASPATVFPAGQGTGRFVVVTSSATETNPGELTYRVIDMALNSGLGGLSGPASVPMTPSAASSAVTSVPNADGTGYWVVNPVRGGSQIVAWQFNDAGVLGTSVTSNVTNSSGLASGTLGHEDIRFSADMTMLATVSSNNGATTTARTQVRLLSFNASTGSVSQLGTPSLQNMGAANRLGYSLDFSGDGSRLYVSSVPPAATGNYYGVQVATTGAAGSRTLSAFANAGSQTLGYGGAVRRGPDGRLYQARSSGSAVSYLPAPNSSPATNVVWSTTNLAAGTTTNRALSNTLADCAIPIRAFTVSKLGADGEPLAGSSFALYPDDPANPGHAGGTPVSPGLSPLGDEVGRFSVTGLAQGTFWLRETQTPPGHKGLTQDVRVNVALDGTVTTPATPVIPEVELVATDGTYTFEITNDWLPARLAILVQVLDPTGDMPLRPDDFAVSASSGVDGLATLSGAPGSMTVVDSGAEKNVIAVRPGVEYATSQTRVTHDGQPQYPSRVVSFQRYQVKVGCPALDLSADPQGQPNMDDACWTTLSANQDSAQITIPLEGGDQIYRFVNTTLAVSELPNASGLAGTKYLIVGGITMALALSFAGLHWGRQSRRR